MTKLELEIFKAVRSADERFQEDGATGSKTWIRDYFLPALEEHDLVIRIKAPSGATAEMVDE